MPEARDCLCGEKHSNGQAASEAERRHRGTERPLPNDSRTLFILGLVHEFNNLHAGILGYAELLEKREELSERSRQMIGAIGESAERGVNLTESLVRFMRQASLPMESANLGDIVADAVESFTERRVAGPEVTVSGPPLPVVRANGVLFRQVVENLLRNANEAIARAQPEHPAIMVHTQADENFAFLTVRDNGSGFAEADAHRIFEPYFTTKSEGVMHGIGLAFCALVAELHGGGIKMYSNPGEGASFTVHLPRHS